MNVVYTVWEMLNLFLVLWWKYWFKLPFGIILWPFKDVLVIKQEILWYYGNRSCYFFLFSRTWWSLMKTREYFQEVYRMFIMLMTLIWYGNLLFDSITWYIFSSVNQFLRFTKSFVVRFQCLCAFMYLEGQSCDFFQEISSWCCYLF